MTWIDRARPRGDVVIDLRAMADWVAAAESTLREPEDDHLAAISDQCALNQVWYSLGERDPEFALLPWLRKRNMPLMAYSPIDQGRAFADPTLKRIAQERGLTAVQVALASLLEQSGVIAIPKATGRDHLLENLAAADVVLTASELEAIERRYPRPVRKAPLAMN